MPADVVPAIAAIVSAFLVFMAALGFASVWSNMGDKPKGRPRKSAHPPGGCALAQETPEGPLSRCRSGRFPAPE